MELTVKIIPHNNQRYDTCGDYQINPATNALDVRISDTKNQDYNFLVTVHEIIEAYLCLKRKIDYNLITEFDVKFHGKGEPGDDKHSPYRREHKFSTQIEKKLAKELGVKWKIYDETINQL